MGLRDYAAITTAVLTFIASAAAQWLWTQRPIQDVIFIALMIAFVGMAIFITLTEPKHHRRRKRRARKWEPDNFKMITLNKEEWNNGITV